ncbi:gustatory receptor 68a isoform X2 [Drosophila grimshawi]|uniref:gustatory receptor 68a isoform X2 n=1 Tax=Drosophila grimshawi TaxID=7222 RepID=UPI000C87142C|nr:gustatory receptor 68a isoform X2 [Drosophila grimshawi]
MVMKILRDIKSVATPIQLCGLLPFFNGDQVDNFSMSTVGKIYARTLAVILLVSSVLLCEDVLFASQGYKLIADAQGDTEDINRTIETLFCIASYTVIVVSSVLNASKHFRTIRDLSKLDEYMEANGYVANYSCRFLGTLLVFVSATVVAVAFYYIHYLSDIIPSRQCMLMLIYSLQMLYSCMLAIYLRTVLKCLAQRIEFLNARLDQFTQKRKHLYEKDDWCKLSNLIEILCKFRYITENVNAVTGVALLFFFGFSFYTVTNQSYLAFATLTTPIKLRKEYNTMGLSCAWVLAETMIMAVICSSFDCLASEANITSQILARVYGKSKEFQNIIDKFLTKSIKQEVQFTAYGFFAIDNSTLFKIFSAVTTYLVILIQFKQLEDSKFDEETHVDT